VITQDGGFKRELDVEYGGMLLMLMMVVLWRKEKKERIRTQLSTRKKEVEVQPDPKISY
jgi:hypothetical protein